MKEKGWAQTSRFCIEVFSLESISDCRKRVGGQSRGALGHHYSYGARRTGHEVPLWTWQEMSPVTGVHLIIQENKRQGERAKGQNYKAGHMSSLPPSEFSLHFHNWDSTGSLESEKKGGGTCFRGLPQLEKTIALRTHFSLLSRCSLCSFSPPSFSLPPPSPSPFPSSLFFASLSVTPHVPPKVSKGKAERK